MNAKQLVSGGWVLALTLLLSATAAAHGERTAHFYDMTWSKTQVAPNDEVIIEGKFRLFKDWPVNLPPPDVAFLGNGTPGPVFVRTESWINGQAAIQSMRLLRNRDYAFKTVLKARLPGRHPMHPMVNVQGAGPLLGPGTWVEVTGRAEDEQGHRLTTGPVHARDSKALEMPLLTTLPAGRYRVKYRVLSVDGHVLDASFKFELCQPEAP